MYDIFSIDWDYCTAAEKPSGNVMDGMRFMYRCSFYYLADIYWPYS